MTDAFKALPGGSETILVVDDHETIWDFLIEALQNLGYCVLLDMIMPEAGGHQTFHRLREIDPDVNVLLSSGYVSEEEVHDLLESGARGFMAKPHRVSRMAREIRRILDEYPHRSQTVCGV